MVADTRTGMCLPSSADTGTLPLGSLISDFESNFVSAARRAQVGFWLNGCRYED